MMTSAKYSTVIALFVTVLISCACSYYVPETEIELSNLTLCQGWDAEEEPISLPDIVSPDETSICICGHLETNIEDVALQVLWGRDGTRLLRSPQTFKNGPFLSCIEDDEGFEPGNYIAIVIAGKTEIGRVEFIVGEE